eukprot:CAMPEP_0195128180 /NCGR_PEP_ID=MMETSP0448-20130528/138630_1 /TAXON_ID=66468 /ORGANISM="Heterocapsa triquestra, Strain CCMP 448" /LENGTH=66 /DNA_ID=CAMNT_0040165967 /DNA_START=18 /DNA_END=214 /DNA_ORIENTATION=+
MYEFYNQAALRAYYRQDVGTEGVGRAGRVSYVTCRVKINFLETMAASALEPEYEKWVRFVEEQNAL